MCVSSNSFVRCLFLLNTSESCFFGAVNFTSIAAAVECALSAEASKFSNSLANIQLSQHKFNSAQLLRSAAKQKMTMKTKIGDAMIMNHSKPHDAPISICFNQFRLFSPPKLICQMN